MLVDVSKEELDKVIKIVKDGGGEVFEQDGYINFCGVRNNATNDTFNDILYIYWKESEVFKGIKTNEFTTKPGKKSIINPINVNGAAIIKEGWHKDIWHHGWHNKKSKNGHEALRQDVGVTKPITITRDNTQKGRSDGKYELRILSDTTETGYPYTNMHRSSSPQGGNVNGWSAGCQVFKYSADFDTMLKMAKIASSQGQKTFSYFLTNKNVFDNTNITDNNENNIDTSIISNTESDSSQSIYSDIINDNSDTSYNNSQYSNNVSNLGSSGVEKNEIDSSTNSDDISREIIESPDSFGTKVILS